MAEEEEAAAVVGAAVEVDAADAARSGKKTNTTQTTTRAENEAFSRTNLMSLGQRRILSRTELCFSSSCLRFKYLYRKNSNAAVLITISRLLYSRLAHLSQ